MEKNERRKYLRVDTSNLLECCCLDEKENEVDHCMVKAIDVSPAGVKIESFQEIETEMIRLVAVEADGNLIESKGWVVHSRKTEDGKYESGICFAGTELENTRFALKLIGVCPQAEPAFVMVKGSEDEQRDRRKYPRIDTNNLITYSCMDGNNNELDQRMARALDINPLGIKIETFQEIISDNIQLTSVDLDGDLIDIRGKIIHCRKSGDCRYEYGISFVSTEVENTRFALKLIEACHKTEPAYIIVKGMKVNS
jgi:c-di-GMP-binding flagellar brake protein YcgR